MMRGISTMSLDAWLFGEEQQQQQQHDTNATLPRTTPPRPHAKAQANASKKTRTKAKSPGRPTATSTDPSVAANVQRSNSLPVNRLSDRVAARAKKASLALAISSTPTTNSTVTTAPRPPSTPGTSHTELFPASSKLRKLFRPNRLQWTRGRPSMGATPEEKQRQLLGLSSESFQRLQGHVPFTLKEIVKDPKKLPYLLRWLSADDEETMLTSTRTNYHQVLLFLLEIEQLQLVAEDKRKEQATKIWNKYIDHSSEFQIATTLELTHELEELVHSSIRSSDTVLDGFFPIQKLAYMRLTREEMPLFLKSPEYLQMLIDTEHDTESVPMERILQQPRAAHYFLLFLMQSRQHFELYFWLHVEYVLKPLLDSHKFELFWKLARVLIKKTHNDSQAITVATKNDLQLAIDQRLMDEKHHPPQPLARSIFVRAQQEIFVMLRSSWFNRFMKSNLYKIALKDCQIHLDAHEAKEDSPPKLLSRTFSSLEYRQHDHSELETESVPSADSSLIEGTKNDEVRNDSSKTFISLDPAPGNELPSGSDDSGNSSGSDSDGEMSAGSGGDDAIDFSKMVLNLESIIRLTKLPDGLQVHYRPNYDAPVTTLLPSDDDHDADSRQKHLLVLDTVLTFATFVEQQGKADTKATLMLMPIAKPTPPMPALPIENESFGEISKRIKAFLVPDGRLMITQPKTSPPPSDVIFPYQQSGKDGFLYGCVYLTYESLGSSQSGSDAVYVSKGICILSRFPLVATLRRLLQAYVLDHRGNVSSDGLFDPDCLSKLYQCDGFDHSTELVSHIPVESIRRCARSESGTTQLSLRKTLLDTRVDVSVLPLFELFGAATALQILGCALLECSIVFVSSHYSRLTTCAEAVRCLLRPFQWCHVYAPVLPKPLLSYLQCPTPILVGMNSSYANRSDLSSSGFYAVADMDRGVLEFVDARFTLSWRSLGLNEDTNGSRVFLPKAFETAKHRLDRLLSPAIESDDLPVHKTSLSGGFQAVDLSLEPRTIEERIRIVCFELLSSLVDGHTEACLVVGDTTESVVIFDETQFLASRATAEDTLFYQSLFRTQCFSEIVSAHRIDTSASDQGAE